MKRILGWSIAIVVIVGSFLAMIFAGGGPENNSPAEDNGKHIDKVSANEWVKGNAESTIELVEYSDFQCPACAAREPLVKALVSEFGSHIKFVYRNFPLRGLHPNADISAQAAEAAGLQGKFWEMHDKIFDNQNQWAKLPNEDAKNLFAGYAQELGLDADQFASDIESGDVKDAVQEDLDSGEDAGVDSTPSFFLNGTYIHPADEDEFRSLIRNAINETTT